MFGTIEIEDPETGERIELEYSVTGRYHPATRWDPAEYPEVDFDVSELPTGVHPDDVTDRILCLERDLADYGGE